MRQRAQDATVGSLKIVRQFFGRELRSGVEKAQVGPSCVVDMSA
jgi:hypothetical protein